MKILLKVVLVLLSGFSLNATEYTEMPDALMLRFPDVSQNQIVFVYAGDIWVVEKDGGRATRLSSPDGEERFPKFSPNGQSIAFSGNYDGNTDVYTMPSIGGTPVRLTHHPDADFLVDWYPDGKDVLYRSLMKSPSYRFNRLFKQSITGGLPETLPLPYGELASFDPSGNRMVFQLISREFRTWKRYRGGMASDIWLYDFEKNFSEKITNFEGTDALPMWHDNTIYYLSDRDQNKKLNIWAYNLDTRQTRQITFFKDYDIKWPSLGPEDIVFENGGKLYLLDLSTEKSQVVHIYVPADLPRVRPRMLNVSKNIQNFNISPTGKRGLFEARGEIYTVPEKHGSNRNITDSPGVAERYPNWSPDGKQIAYFSDKSGEYELYIRAADGSGSEKQLTRLGKGFRYYPKWAPNSKYIAFYDKAGQLWVVDIDQKKPTIIDKDDHITITDYSWSPDSRWLAYSRTMQNRNRAIIIYDMERKSKHQVTSDYYDDMQPVFDPEGKYLYFYSNRTFEPVYSDYDATWVYPNATDLYAATLRKDLDSPIGPQSDEEGKDESEKKDEKEEKSNEKEEPKTKEPEPVEIDFTGFEQRVVKLPVKAGNVGILTAVKGKVVWQRNPVAGAAERGKPQGTLVYFDLKEREEKTVIEGIDTYILSADGKKFIYKTRNVYGIEELGENKKVGENSIAANKLQTQVDPEQEWKQIFLDAWRLERDFFYDPNLHGVDWRAIKNRYQALLPYVVDREDLNYIIGEMIAELSASHTYVGGGDVVDVKKISVGLLGCDFELDQRNNLYRIKKIYAGADWDTESRSPLKRPGIQVNPGDYILAVNQSPLDTTKDPWAAFQGLADETVTLTVSSTPDGTDKKDILVKPISSELRLRNLAWIEENRNKVLEASDGKIGYIYVPDTGINGQNELVRQFIPQMNRQGLIIDERFNSGGQIPDRFVELLNRPVYNYWARRDHKDWRTPFVTHVGPKAMLINGWSGSGGDAFPYYFRKAGLGPLIGTRTWGGLIGISGNPPLIDGGRVTVPTFGFWNTKGNWEVEGYGVEPDYAVINKPHEMVAGRDPQLEKAIEILLQQLSQESYQIPEKPSYPDRSGK